MTLQQKTGFLLRHAYQQLNKHFRKMLVQENITTHQYVVMVGIDELGDPIQRTLAEYCAIEPSNLNVMIRKMREAGLVEPPDPARSGRDTVRLTGKGQDILQRFEALEVSVTKEFLSPLSASERKALHTALAKLTGN